MTLRMTLVALAGALTLAAVALFAYALAAARVPQHRAALEQLVHAQTGLDVRFSELTLRWGWYGPEAVFRDVELAEPARPGALLTAPELVVGVDLWPMLRSGALQIGRITLVNPAIDVTRAPPMQPARAARAPALATGTRLLAGWRGTRIDVEGGTLRAAPAGAPLALGIRRITLRRSGTQWYAEALLTLPETLGASAHAVLELSGDPAVPADLAGTLEASGTRLEFAPWRALLASVPGAQYLPGSGRGNLSVRLQLTHGGLARADGSVQAEALAWPAAGSPAAGLALERLRATWHLAHDGADWHLSVDPLELSRPGQPPAALSLDAASDAAWVRGRVQGAPVAVLASLARGLVPGLALPRVELDGMVREASFDWRAGRPQPERLRTAAEIHDLTLGVRDGALRLAGLQARVTGDGRSLRAELYSLNARLTRADGSGSALGHLEVSARVDLDDSGHGWRVSTRDLEVRQADARLSASAVLAGDDSGAHPLLTGHATLSGARLELLRGLLDAQQLESLGGLAPQLIAGRIEQADVSVRGPLDEPLPWSAPQTRFSGALLLTDGRLAQNGDWPELHDVSARLDWRGARVHVRIDEAAAAGFRLLAARGEWDARDARPARLSGRLSGQAEEALAWLRDHPQLKAYAPGLGSIDLRGATLLDFDLRRAANTLAPARPPRLTTRITALLDGARLDPVAGVPAIEALRGTLAFADGHLQRSTLTGQWLGGPISLNVGERRERAATALVISGRGLLNVRQALLAATGVSAEASPVQGSAEWSAELRLLPPADGQPASWQARADSSLIGLTSRLPEPFAKGAGAALALHLELGGTDDQGELRLALGERLRGLAAVKRRGDLWQIERGAVNFAANAPALPAEPVMHVEGTLSRLDLPGYAALWRQLTHDPAWPALRVELTAAELLAAGRSFTQVRVSANSAAGADRLQLESADLAGVVRWPAAVDAAHPVIAHLTRLNVPRLAETPAMAGLIAALGPVTQLSVEDFEWQGRSLGALAATFAAGDGALDVTGLRLSGAGDEAGGALHCQEALCRASFSLVSHDAAGLLAYLGFRPDLAASETRASGELAWPAQAEGPVLAGLSGRLHVQLDDGVTHGAGPAAGPGTPLGLLAVPALTAGLGLPELRFARLSADFAVADGEAVTTNLHLDGTAEILVRGRIGLAARDYDAQVWVLRGEERLPAAVRRLGPGSRVAALWLSLRELFAAGGAEREHAALRLRGTWEDPMVTVAD
jgi:uncharacterized protein YhdP